MNKLAWQKVSTAQ